MFIELMRDYEAVVSGCHALEFIMPSPDVPWTLAAADLDLYVPLGLEQPFIDFLEIFEGYDCKPRTRPASRKDLVRLSIYPNTFSSMFTLHHPDTKRSIDIIVSCDASPLSPIFQFHSTPVMNWITADAVCSAYPLYTFASRGIVNPLVLADDEYLPSSLRAIYKYRRHRHFDFQLDPSPWLGWHDCSRPLMCPHSVRSTIDGACLCVTFNGDSRSMTGRIVRDDRKLASD
ncbi:hypothetical protein BD410DRAFT_753461, partial [Rickenella mellea]